MGLGQCIGLLATAAAAILLWNLKGVLLLVFTAVVLARILTLPVGALQKHLGWRRPWAFLLVLFSLILVIFLASVLLVPPFVTEFRQLIAQLPEAFTALLTLLDEVYGSLVSFAYGANADVPDSITELLRLRIDPGAALGHSFQGILDFAGNLGGGLVQTVFVLALAVMMAIQPAPHQKLVIRLTPSFYRRRMEDILHQCGEALGNLLMGILISSICVSLMAGIGLSIMGVKLVVANALLAGLLNVIPNLGPTLSTVFPISVALTDSLWKVVGVVVLYGLVQNIESYGITPYVMHQQVKLLPGLTLLSQFVFTVLLGPLGLLMALPLVVVIQVLVREVLVRDVMDQWLLNGESAVAKAMARQGD